MRVYKYALKFVPVAGNGVYLASELLLPKNSVVRHVGVQFNDIYAWVESSEEEKSALLHTFYLVGTGWVVHLPEDAKFVKTVFQEGFVWHIYSNVPSEI